MKSFSDVDALEAQIRATLNDIGVIGIDGFCGSGKTFLARQLSKALKADLISTDCHVVKQGGHWHYVDRLDLTALSNSLHQTAGTDRKVILEGICLLEVITRLGVSTNSVRFVYVKRLSKNSGIWHDGFDLEDFENSDSASTGIPEPHLSVFRYHRVFNPHRSADFEYQRIDHP
ncbi:MAG: hypothetical protein OXC19_15860 [Bryobacterales bacterium]|nr:hypothetical protein [Bryobacterales bacterium]